MEPRLDVAPVLISRTRNRARSSREFFRDGGQADDGAVDSAGVVVLATSMAAVSRSLMIMRGIGCHRTAFIWTKSRDIRTPVPAQEWFRNCL